MAMNAVGGAALGSIGQTQQQIPVTVKLDTSAATTALSEFEGTAKKDVQKPLTIDSTKATASISEVRHRGPKGSQQKPQDRHICGNECYCFYQCRCKPTGL